MSKPTFLGPLIGKGAGQYELIHADQGSVLAAQVEPAFDSKTRKRGLLGRDAVPEDYALILAPCSGIHTFSMRFPMDAVFVSRDGTVVKTCRELKPWRIAVAWRAFAVIEAAAGFIDRTQIVPGEAVALREIPQKRRATDALPPQPEVETGGRKLHKTDALKRVTLADVIARKTPLGWFESVAIVQELCEVALARGPVLDPRVPELKHIALTADGNIELLSQGPAEHSPVHRASLVLLALTPEAELPTQLRLLALEEVSPKPKLGDLKDLHTELEFFERPDRRELIRAVHERLRQQLASAAEAAVPPPLLEPPLPKRHHRWWRNKNVWIGTGIVLASLLVAAGIWEFSRPEGEWMRSRVARAGRAAAGLGGRTLAAARRDVAVALRRFGLRSDLAVEGSAAPPPSAPRPTAPSRFEPGTVTAPTSSPRGPAMPGPAATPGQPPLPGQALPMGQVEAAPSPPPPTAQPATGAPPLTPTAARSVPTSLPATGELPVAATVYSSSDPLVVPPELLRPSLPSGPPPGVRVEDMAEVEVVVSPTGEVRSVRLVSPGIGPRPAMMLSAVKAWRFQPATRGGQPVHFRLRLRLPAS
jgi:uncharacterized membrane protein (UPF0127 family)